jgi:hypothetical protein
VGEWGEWVCGIASQGQSQAAGSQACLPNPPSCAPAFPLDPPHHTPPRLVSSMWAVQVQAQNLMILQRKDEAVSEILATATYVVIYVFEPKGKQWERKEVRGWIGRIGW